jgi:hypothetical protein
LNTFALTEPSKKSSVPRVACVISLLFILGALSSISSNSAHAQTTTGDTSQLTVSTRLNGGGEITGLYTVLYQNGNVVADGYTPAQFTVNNGQTYAVEIQNYGSYYFQYWMDSGSVNDARNITANSNMSITGVICDGPPGTCRDSTPVDGITVYAHRIRASYWAPCFATACSQGTGPGATMYFVLYDSSGKIVQTGFANEQGYTFTGLSRGSTYFVYPEDCDLCHGSSHDVLFQHWGSGINSNPIRPLAAMVGTSLDAWYTCTNGCGD